MLGLGRKHTHPKILSNSLWEYMNSGLTEEVLVSIAVAVPQEILIGGKFVGTTWMDCIPRQAIPLTPEQEVEKVKILKGSHEFLQRITRDPTLPIRCPEGMKSVYFLTLTPTQLRLVVESPLIRFVNIQGGYPKSFKPTV